MMDPSRVLARPGRLRHPDSSRRVFRMARIAVLTIFGESGRRGPGSSDYNRMVRPVELNLKILVGFAISLEHRLLVEGSGGRGIAHQVEWVIHSGLITGKKVLTIQIQHLECDSKVATIDEFSVFARSKTRCLPELIWPFSM